MFQFEAMTRVRVLDVLVLAAKDRKPDDPPGAQLSMKATVPADVLSQFDGFLPGMLFRKAGSASRQPPLDGVDGGQELTAIGDHVKRLKWVYEQTGCEIEIDYGGGGSRNITLSDVRVHRVSFAPRQGGSVDIWFTVDAPALGAATWQRLPGFKATEISMTLLGPEPADDLADEQQIPAKRGRKAAEQPAATH